VQFRVLEYVYFIHLELRGFNANLPGNFSLDIYNAAYTQQTAILLFTYNPAALNVGV
jgi:hypothetical protein